MKNTELSYVTPVGTAMTRKGIRWIPLSIFHVQVWLGITAAWAFHSQQHWPAPRLVHSLRGWVEEE